MTKIYWKKTFIINCILSLFIFSLIFSCNFKSDKNIDIDDAFFKKLAHYYNEKPDSAIILANQAEKKYIQNEEYVKLVRLYGFLSELYQYRKNDEYKALSYINLALDIFVQHPELEYDKTFIYINTGNILYRYKLYEEAIYVYRQIENISEKFEDPEVISLIFNNIALAYEGLENCDSAKYYFNKTPEYIEKCGEKEYLLKIQYYNYLASLSFLCENIDSIPIYFNKTQELYENLDNLFLNSTSQEVKNYQKESKLNYYTNLVRAHTTLSDYYIIKKDFTKAVYNLNIALNNAKTVNLETRYYRIYSSLYDSYFNLENYETALKYLDTSLNWNFTNNKNFEEIIEINENYSKTYKALNNNQLANYHKEQANLYTDSLIFDKNSEELVLKKIELAVLPVQLAMKDVELSKIKQDGVIERQSIFIYILLFGLVFIIITLSIYYKLYKNLKNTQQELAYKTITNIKGTDIRTSSKRMGDATETQLIEKFEDEIIKPKVFLDTNLNLNLVAEKLNSNRSYVSAIINNVYGMNYNDYINKLRIEEACQKIINNTNPNFTIDHLYSEVGFTGKSTFYNAFKKYVGVTPAVFFKLNSKI
ncbi:MAG: AraC family transcriptional regulator [Bacteroidales bacterium]|nr:AraC family transcriptional regulator [Bacteroidales bacterium]MCK9499404.1 AraC family transcriptional regulator [Bacteroidales bacterium]